MGGRRPREFRTCPASPRRRLAGRRLVFIRESGAFEMLREIRRFNVADDSGRSFEMVEVIAFRNHEGVGRMNSAPTFFLAGGGEAFPTARFGEYSVPREGLIVREVRQRQPRAP